MLLYKGHYIRGCNILKIYFWLHKSIKCMEQPCVISIYTMCLIFSIHIDQSYNFLCKWLACFWILTRLKLELSIANKIWLCYKYTLFTTILGNESLNFTSILVSVNVFSVVVTKVSVAVIQKYLY